jgi:hypothetical protein
MTFQSSRACTRVRGMHVVHGGGGGGRYEIRTTGDGYFKKYDV